MEKEVKHYVLVSTKIPHEFEVLTPSEGGTPGFDMAIIDGWDYRVYEVPEFGNFEGVEVTKDDRFIAQVQGYSLTEIEDWFESGIIGDMRAWQQEYRIFTPKGDYVDIAPSVQDTVRRTYEPQRFGLESFPSWNYPNVEIGDDLTEGLFDL